MDYTIHIQIGGNVKVSLIGCGDIANRYYGPCMAKMKEEGIFTSMSCCDTDTVKAQVFADTFGIDAFYSDVHAMIHTACPDCLIIATPVNVTTSIAIEVSSYGIPMLIEKPPALTRQGGAQLEEALQRYSVLHQVAFNRHHMPVVKYLKQDLVEKKRRLQYINSTMSRHRRTEDTFHVTAIHSIDLMRYIAGSPFKSARFTYQDLPGYGNHVSNIFMDCVFTNGVWGRASMMVSCGTTNERMTVTCDDATYEAYLPVWDCGDVPGIVRCHEHNKELYCVSGTELSETTDYVLTGFYTQLESFIQNIKIKKQPFESMAYALQSVEIAHRIALREYEYGE